MKPAVIRAMLAAVPKTTLLYEHIDELADVMSKLEYARRFVPYVVARGALALDDDSGVSPIINTIAETACEVPYLTRQRDERIQKIEKLIDQKDLGELEDLFYAFQRVGQEAGYLLGLAVGQHLGQHAFDGGAS